MMEAYKKSALRLHSLADADREWMLEQLQMHQRQKLVPLLEELAALGIPRQQDFADDIDDLYKEAPAPEPTEPASEPPGHVKPLLDVAPEALHLVLAAETAETVAAFLLVHPWPWQQLVLDMFAADHRALISEAMDQIEGNLSPYVGKALVGAVVRQLNEPPELPADDSMAVPDSIQPVRRWSLIRRWKWRR